MTAPTGAMLAVLQVARDGGSVDRAVTAAGKDTIVHAATWNLIRIVHDNGGVVGARWATEQAGHVQQRDNLHLELTDAGREHLAGA